MHSRIVLGLVLGASCVLGALAYAQGVSVQRDVAVLDPATAQAQLERAEKESADAQARAEQLAQDAEQATQEADKTAREAAALAAQIQQAEADIRAAQARYSLAQDQRNTLAARLAERQQPLVKLTAALQTMSRRPLALSALQPGSLRETVYVRAVLDGAVPEVR
ncbi:MAG: metalloendopeptidase, partial [Pseudomonadota bacterium]